MLTNTVEIGIYVTYCSCLVCLSSIISDEQSLIIVLHAMLVLCLGYGTKLVCYYGAVSWFQKSLVILSKEKRLLTVNAFLSTQQAVQ